MGTQFFQDHLLKSLYLLHSIAFVLLPRADSAHPREPVPGVCTRPHSSACLSHSDYTLSPNFRNGDSPPIPHTYQAILESLFLHIHFKISLFMSTKILIEILIGIVFNPHIEFGGADVFAPLQLPLPLQALGSSTSLIGVWSFSPDTSCASSVPFVPKYFIFLG